MSPKKFLAQKFSNYSSTPTLARLVQERLQQLPRNTENGTGIVGYYPEYRPDPVGFCTDILGIELWESEVEGEHGQCDIARALVASKTVAVRSGHKVGKSTVAAALGIWFYSCFDEARVILTAPTHRQVSRVLWREVRKLIRNSKKPISIPEDGVPKMPNTGLETDDSRELWGFTTDDPDKFSGISGKHVLYIGDEAPGIADDIFEAIEGNRAGGAWMLLLGNPTQTSGTFYDLFHTGRSHCATLHIDSRNTPKAIGRAIPGLATEEWCAERAAVWGVDSPIHDVRVAGNFPRQAENAVISLALLEAALVSGEKMNGASDKAELRIGVDPARFGDDETVIQPVQGYKMFTPIVLSSMDTIEVAGAVLKVLRDHGGGVKTVINVDSVGIGAGVFDQLKRHKRTCVAVSCETGRKSDDPDQYNNLRSQLHFGLRDWLAEGGGLLPDPTLEGELVAPTYTFDAQGRYVVESKDEIKRRIKHSPDRMDALSLAVYKAPIKKKARYDDKYDANLPSVRM